MPAAAPRSRGAGNVQTRTSLKWVREELFRLCSSKGPSCTDNHLSTLRMVLWRRGRFASTYCALTTLSLHKCSEGHSKPVYHSKLLYSITSGRELGAERPEISLLLLNTHFFQICVKKSFTGQRWMLLKWAPVLVHLPFIRQLWNLWVLLFVFKSSQASAFIGLYVHCNYACIKH